MTCIIGTTSYGYRYQLLDEREAPPLPVLVRQTRAAGLEALQICENARPLQAGEGEWRDTVRAAGDEGVALHVGCMTLDPEVLARYLDRASAIDGAAAVRIVLEDESGQAPSRDRLERFLAAAAERAIAAGMMLALENHFHVPCRTLLALAGAYPPDVMAFCIDSANSLRNWESAEQVFDLLGERAAFYHLKDYRVHGSNVGFEVTGAPLGEGALDLAGCVARMRARHETPLVFLETWVPASGDRRIDLATEADWLARSRAAMERAMDGIPSPVGERGQG
jgi:sugar phosphate isomerase/epimerase